MPISASGKAKSTVAIYAEIIGRLPSQFPFELSLYGFLAKHISASTDWLTYQFW